MIRSVLAAVLLTSAFPLSSLADSHQGSTASAQTASQLSEGEVRKVDKETQKITIRHGPLKNLDMPPMTMVFQVKNAAMLDQVKAGDKVRFSAEKTDGAFTVTHIEAAK
jgi:Cu(I)/Ag(I) efflux system periplasmic protein CusF